MKLSRISVVNDIFDINWDLYTNIPEHNFKYIFNLWVNNTKNFYEEDFCMFTIKLGYLTLTKELFDILQ